MHGKNIVTIELLDSPPQYLIIIKPLSLTIL